MTNSSLLTVESIAECSIYFWPALFDNWSWKPIFGFEKQFLVFLRVVILDKFYCTTYPNIVPVLETVVKVCVWLGL